MFAVVAGGVVPAAVKVEGVVSGGIGCCGCGGRGCGAGCCGRQGKMTIGFVDETGGTLAFEIINNVRQCRFLKNIPANAKGMGACSTDLYPIDTSGSIWTEVDGPEQPVFPFVDRAAEGRFSCVDDLAGAVVDELEYGECEAACGFDHRTFGLGGFIAHLVGENANG